MIKFENSESKDFIPCANDSLKLVIVPCKKNQIKNWNLILCRNRCLCAWKGVQPCLMLI